MLLMLLSMVLEEGADGHLRLLSWIRVVCFWALKENPAHVDPENEDPVNRIP